MGTLYDHNTKIVHYIKYMLPNTLQQKKPHTTNQPPEEYATPSRVTVLEPVGHEGKTAYWGKGHWSLSVANSVFGVIKEALKLFLFLKGIQGVDPIVKKML